MPKDTSKVKKPSKFPKFRGQQTNVELRPDIRTAVDSYASKEKMDLKEALNFLLARRFRIPI